VAKPTADPIGDVQKTLDLLNQQIKALPSGVRPWVEWSAVGYPEVILVRTEYSRRRLTRAED
jgi:hypothetical protein